MPETSLDWSNSTVGDLCSLLNGLPFKPEDWTQRGTPIIRIQNLNGSQEFNYYDKTIPEAFHVPPGTLLFSWSGNRGTSFGPYQWSGPTGILNQHIFKVSPKAEVNSSWLYYALDIARQLAERAAHGGSGLVHVRRGDLLGYHIPTPPLPEQHKIAQILDFVGKQLQTAEKLVAKLKLVKQGLLHDLLTRGIDDNGELRDPDRHPEQFQDSPLGRIPRNWTSRPLQEVTTAPICYGIVQPGPYCPHGPFVLTISDLHGDFSSGLHRVDPRIDAQYARSRVRASDLLLSIKGTIGRVGIAPEWYSGNISRDLGRSRFASAVIPQFASQYLSGPIGQRRLELSVVGTTRAELSIRVLVHLQIPVPPVPEQSQIVERLGALDRLLSFNERSLAKLRLLKQALMDDLLTGRVRVTPLLEGNL